MTVFDRKGANISRLLALAIAASTALGVLLTLLAIAGAQQRSPIVEKLAKTYGRESFGQIEAICYTFNVQSTGLNLSRSWTWEPKTDQVTYEGKDKSGKPVKVTYLRSQGMRGVPKSRGGPRGGGSLFVEEKNSSRVTMINLYLFRDSAPVAGLNFPSGHPS
jgi:hypothetical protein